MRYTSQPTVYDGPKQPHTIIIARGDEVRHFTVRPWIAATAGCAIAAISIGYLAATAYLFLRDDLIGASMARQAHMQQAYEDRISSLRAQLDRVTSRQLLDQQFMQRKVGELLKRQDKLTERQGQLSPLLERFGAIDKADAPLPTPRPAQKAATTFIDDASIDTITTASAFAAPSTRNFAWPLREADRPKPSQPSQDDDWLLSKLNGALHSIESEQMASVKSLADSTYQTVETIADALQTAGISLGQSYGDQDVGGPLIPASSNQVFKSQVQELDVALNQLEAIKRTAIRLPLANPAPGTAISSRFGTRSDPFLGRAAHHSGIDFRAQRGTLVSATGAGRVVKAGWNGGYGRMVEIDHGNGMTSRYAHLNKVLVSTGQDVEAGAIIGRVGSSGRSTGPHLHYEVRENGTALNPASFLSAGRKIAQYL